MKTVTRFLVPSSLLAVMASAHAAVDLAPITTAQTDALAVAAALFAMAVAVWAALYVKRRFFGS